MNEKVLLVDDDPEVLSALSRHLRRRFDIRVATGGAEALEMAESQGPFAVVLCDMSMPEIDGIEVLGTLRERAPDTVRMMLTGNIDQQTAVAAVNRAQVFRFFNKPFSANEIAIGVQQALRHYRLVLAERELLEETLMGRPPSAADEMIQHEQSQASQRNRGNPQKGHPLTFGGFMISRFRIVHHEGQGANPIPVLAQVDEQRS